MTLLRRTTRLLLTLYVISYVSLIVPWHLQVSYQDGCCGQANSTLATDSHASTSDHHDHTRCQICLTGGAVHTIPLHVAIDADLLLVGCLLPTHDFVRLDPGSHASFSRAPPVVS